jgi:ATP-binding cassette subfamily F protein 3
VAFVQFSNVSLSFGDREILKNVSLNLQSGSKAALAGVNGSGKTTLLRILAGEVHPDSGERALEKGARVGYLPQSGVAFVRGLTVREEADRAFEAGYALVREQENLTADLR